METSQPIISIESFSYRWLVNIKPSLDSLEYASIEASSFIEMDPRMPPSKRFNRISQDFKFDFPISQSPFAYLHADELFSNGYVMPIFVNPLKLETYAASDLSPTLPTSSNVQTNILYDSKTPCSSIRRRRILSRQMIQKYLFFLRPLYKRIKGCKPNSKAVCADSRFQAPKISIDYSESSIYEAVLHCKRSISMPNFKVLED